MDYSFFALGLIALCVTALALAAMVLCFCYKQEKDRVLLKGQAKVTKDEFSSEITLDIDNKNKKSKQSRQKRN